MKASASPTDVSRLLAEAASLSQRGQWAAAEAACRRLLAGHPAEPTALHLLGVSLLQQGRAAQAEAALAACLQARPNEPAALANRGIALQALGRLDEALACYAQALALAPRQAATLNMQGLALLAQQRPAEALASFDQALAAAPALAEAWCNRAQALIHLRRYEDALDSLGRASTMRPDYGEALANRAVVLNLLGRHAEALTAAEAAHRLLPQQPAVLRSLADSLAALQRFDEALQHCDEAIDLAPGDLTLRIARGDLHAASGRGDAAEADYERALAMLDERVQRLQSPQAGAESADRWPLAQALYERGLVLVDLGRHREAIASFARATSLVEDFAEAHWAEALNRLRLGDYETGWREYEWRQRTASVGLGLRRFDAPKWLGEEDQRGLHILLHAEQGFGDTLQFCRYAPALAARGARVTLLAPPALRRLLRSLNSVDVITDGDPLPEFDRHCPLLSLPLAFGTTLETVPRHVPYLSADAEAIARWRAALRRLREPRIGLVWSGNVRHAKDRERSLALSAAEPLLARPAGFVSLVKDVRPTDRARLARLPLPSLGESLADFADTAALIEALDLVITVDTAVAHLAGALGKPVWILLDARPDFRWMLDRDDTPWYPTARLFRQRAPGDWADVVHRVGQALDDELDALRGRRNELDSTAAHPSTG